MINRDFFHAGLANTSNQPNSDGSLLSLEAANKLGHGWLFDSVISRQDTWDANDSLPLLRKNVNHIVIPYEYDAHHEIPFKDRNLEDVLTYFANQWLGEHKYLLSCNKDFFYGVSISEFDYDHVDTGFETGGQNSHFILFDDSKNRWIVFYSRFPFITVSWIDPEPAPIISGKKVDYWPAYFQEKSAEAFQSHSTEFVDFINRTYMPRFKDYEAVNV